MVAEEETDGHSSTAYSRSPGTLGGGGVRLWTTEAHQPYEPGVRAESFLALGQ